MDGIENVLNNRKPFVMGYETLFQSAVLVPLIEQDGSLSVLFEQRALHLRRQPGEIGFPGGRIDPQDIDPQAAAIREACEELGIDADQIEIVGPLDYVVTAFQIVYPFVGRIKRPEHIRPNPEEVAEVFLVPLEKLRTARPELHFVDVRMEPPDDFPFERIPNGRDYKWRSGQIPEYFYEYEGRVIWGLTARILHHFLTLIG